MGPSKAFINSRPGFELVIASDIQQRSRELLALRIPQLPLIPDIDQCYIVINQDYIYSHTRVNT